MSTPATPSVVHSDPDILGGTPVFVGTRVPLRNLIEIPRHPKYNPANGRPSGPPTIVGNRTGIFVDKSPNNLIGGALESQLEELLDQLALARLQLVDTLIAQLGGVV